MGDPILDSSEDLLTEREDTRRDPDSKVTAGDTKPDPDGKKGSKPADLESKIDDGDVPG